jgi:hypothetical protein
MIAPLAKFIDGSVLQNGRLYLCADAWQKRPSRALVSKLGFEIFG